MAKINATTEARIDTKKSAPAEVLALVTALDPSKENREIVRSVLGSIFHGSMRRDPVHATLIARAAFGLSGSSGEKYLSAFFYTAKDGTTKPFDGTPLSVVTLTEKLADLRRTVTHSAFDQLCRVKGTSFEETAQKQYDRVNKLASSDTAGRVQARINGILLLLENHIAQCREWVKASQTPETVPTEVAPTVKLAKPVKPVKPAELEAAPM